MNSEAENQVASFKSDIRAKFKSVRRYCEIAGINYYDLNLLFTNYINNPTSQRAAAVKREIERFESGEGDGKSLDNEVTAAMVDKVRAGMIEKYGKAAEFCKSNPDFDKFFVSRLLNYKIKTKKNPLVGRIIEMFN